MKNKNSFFKVDDLLMVGSMGILFVLFLRLYFSMQPEFTKIQKDYTTGRAINLYEGFNSDSLKKILINYYQDDKDIKLITDSLSAKLSEYKKLENLGAINKRSFQILAPIQVKSPIGGKDFQSRLEVSRQRMGFDSVLYQTEFKNPKVYPSVMGAETPLYIKGKVVVKDSEGELEGVLVQLRKHSNRIDDEVTADSHVYTRTDRNGEFRFNGLSKDSSYSVIPLKPGLEFGTRQGTTEKGLVKPLDFTFKAQPHKIRLIGSTVYSQLKEDKVLTVRTPKEFNQIYLTIIAIFFLLFAVLYAYWSFVRFNIDSLILPILMFLTGVSLLILFSVQDPLQETLFAYQTLWGVGVGLLFMATIAYLPVGRWYVSKWYFDILGNFKFRQLLKGNFEGLFSRNTYKLEGYTWLALAVILALLVLAFGDGPDGSGVKVNLDLKIFEFQPSELTKYLLLVFFAAFFAANEKNIRALSDARWRFYSNIGVLFGTLTLIIIYLLLGDMGPALVVCFTFLLFYSIARGNLAITLIVGCVYGILLVFLPSIVATLISLVLAVGLLLWKGLFKTTRLRWWIAIFAEAPMILMVIIAAFTFGDKLPFVGDRLAQRKEMWLNIWNNNVEGGGGDHLAHAYWTLASGSFSGQGLGKGFANTMPAAHTDMILPSIGEELGFLGLISIFILFAILIHRIILHARKAGQPFAFYLCTGIALSLGIQFFLIACGSIGLLPLTGISVPFLSYGKVSLIINLAALGVVIGISREKGEDIQQEYIQKYYDPVILSTMIGVFIGILILSAKLAHIQIIAKKDFVVKPSRVLNRNGLPIYSYNPRIEIFTKAIAAGTIYDRNNLILATSSLDKIKAKKDALLSAGISENNFEDLIRKKLNRYYPFEENTFFWTGDYNTKLLWSQAGGYFAESRHLSDLRGFDTKPSKSEVVTTRFKQDRFSKPVRRAVTMVSYDYSPLADMLVEGLSGSKLAALKTKNRDLNLSIDAALQIEIQRAIQNSTFNNKRVSVVVLDSKSGDVLASAIHPLPNLQKPDEMLLSEKERFNLKHLVTERDLGFTYPTAPGSTAKILTALAGLNKKGLAAAQIAYNDITKEEIIRSSNKESEPYGESVDMRKAIVKSSNVYFIRLANEEKLDDEMANLYLATGMNIDYMGGYSFNNWHNQASKTNILNHWREASFSVNRDFYEKRPKGKRERYDGEFSGLAWGQGKLTSSPASMARMASIIANDGILQPSRYVIKKNGISEKIQEGLNLVNDKNTTRLLTDFMIEQSNPIGGNPKISQSRVAGKTGTPQRTISKKERFDGWYVFFAPTPSGSSKTVVCIRIELGEYSSNAVKLADEKIVPILVEKGYLGTF